jgi:hypothetical protein
MPLHTDEKRQGGTNNASRDPHASLGARAEGRRNKQTPGKNQHIYVSNINPADSWDKCSTSCALIANRHVRRKLKIQNNQTQIDQFSKCKRNPQIIPSARQTHKGGRYVLYNELERQRNAGSQAGYFIRLASQTKNSASDPAFLWRSCSSRTWATKERRVTSGKFYQTSNRNIAPVSAVHKATVKMQPSTGTWNVH